MAEEGKENRESRDKQQAEPKPSGQKLPEPYRAKIELVVEDTSKAAKMRKTGDGGSANKTGSRGKR